MEMKYDLATNFDDELLRKVAEYGVVKSIYGKLQSDVVGGGRPSFTLPAISKKQLQSHIDTAHDCGIQFSYLFNALCSDNREFLGKSNLQMRDFISELKDRGVDIITVGSPFMLNLVKDVAPNLEVSVSVYDDVDSIERIKAWEKQGADELTLHYSFNRNFRKLAQALQTTDLNLRVLANNTCLHECIYRANHANALAHSSQSKHSSGGFFLDYYSLNCGKEKFKSPAKFIAADWIRPEDVHHYEEVCDKIGKTNLTLKLTERSRPTDWLVRVVKAYAEKSYPGDLMDILNYRNVEFPNASKRTFIIGAITGKARADKMGEFQKAVFPSRVHIDNTKLNGFMDYFVGGHECSEHVCDIEGWPDEEGENLENSCGYCRTVAKKVLTFEGGEQARQDCVERAENSLNDLTSGAMFKK